MIRAGRELSVDPLLDLVLAAPRDHRIDQTIAASVLEISRREALRDKDPAIIILVGVKAQMLASTGARLGGVALEDDDHARAYPFIGSHDRARLLGMRRKTHIGMRALRLAR